MLLLLLLRRRLVLETDAPALGPDKDAVNVPANITVSCAEVRGLLWQVLRAHLADRCVHVMLRLLLYCRVLTQQIQLHRDMRCMQDVSHIRRSNPSRSLFKF